jgi:hypothetical protein
VARLKTIARVVAGIFGFLVYVWFAAVRNAALVKRRKAARRRAAGPLED